jgi:hypothetical protein
MRLRSNPVSKSVVCLHPQGAHIPLESAAAALAMLCEASLAVDLGESARIA